MLNLTNAGTDKLQLTTTTAATIDVHASWADLNGTTVTPGRTNTAISSATTTDIVATPSASTTRNTKTLHIRNKDSSLGCDITLLYNANGTTYELFKATLAAGDVLEYVEGVGFFVVAYANKAILNRRVSSDYTNSTTSFTDVTGLTAPVTAGKHYNFEAQLFTFSAATTTGVRFGVNGPSLTSLRLQALQVVTGSVTAAAMSANVSDVTAYDTAIIAQTTGPATTPVLVILSGWITCSASGTFAIRGASEVAASAITVKTGSWLQIWEVD